MRRDQIISSVTHTEYVAYSCGHEVKGIEVASRVPVPERVKMNHECSECYTGPYANVWD